jgi:hypothetical protein
MGCGETLSIEALVELTLGRSWQQILVFLAKIADEFFLEPYVLRAYDAKMDAKRHLLQLRKEEL